MRAKIDADISREHEYFPADIGSVKVQHSEASKKLKKLTSKRRNENQKWIDDRELLEKSIEIFKKRGKVNELKKKDNDA